MDRTQDCTEAVPFNGVSSRMEEEKKVFGGKK